MFKKTMKAVSMIVVIAMLIALVPAAVFAENDNAAADVDQAQGNFESAPAPESSVLGGGADTDQPEADAGSEAAPRPDIAPQPEDVINSDEEAGSNEAADVDPSGGLPAPGTAIEDKENPLPLPSPEPLDDSEAAPEENSGENDIMPVNETVEAADDGNVTWELSADGTLTISGQGEMTDTSWDKSAVKRVVINEGVTSISGGAFDGCAGLIEITIPESMTSIGNRAFENCTSLSYIYIPENVTNIGWEAYYNCTNVTKIEWNAVNAKSGDNDNIYNRTFYNVGQESDGIELIFGDKVETIPRDAFSGYSNNNAKLKSVKFGSGLREIKGHAFRGRSEITEITIPSGTETIGEYAFDECSALNKVTIPARVTNIGGYAFDNCPELKTAGPIGGGYNLEFSWNDNICYNAFANGESWTKIVLPEGATSISDNAFFNCAGLIEITIPESITSIGSRAFENCTSLLCIYIPENVTNIGWEAYYNCTNVTKIEWNAVNAKSGNNNYLERCTFENVGQNAEGIELIFGDKVETIPGNAFSDFSANNAKLSVVTVPVNVKNIGSNAFNGQNDMVMRVYPDSYAEQYAVDNNINYELILGSSIRLSVLMPDGSRATDGYTVNWYEKGSNNVIGTGTILRGTEEGKEYEYEVALDEKLCFDYKAPARGTAVYGESPSVTLEKRKTVTVSGNAADENGTIPENMTIRVAQIIGDHTRNIDTALNGGAFSFSASNAPTVVYISTNGYYTASKAAITAQNELENIELDTITLKKLPENRIKVSVYEKEAAVEGMSGLRSELTSYDNVTIGLKDAANGREITDFTAQYPYIIINDSEVGAGDEIEITVSSTAAKEGSAKVTLDAEASGSAGIELLRNGKFYTSAVTADKGMYVLVFDQNGGFVKRYAPSDTELYSDAMPDGDYSIVFLEKNIMLRSVSSIDKLGEYGLGEGRDYVLRTVRISAGTLTKVGDFTVPALDLSDMYYTVENSTGVTANKSEAAVGNIVTIRAEYEIDSKYSADNEELTVEIPDGAEVLEGSVTLDGKLVNYSIDNGTMTIKTNKDKATVRFYVSAVKAGEYDINAALGMNIGGDSIAQPIGTARFEAAALKMEVPSISASGKVTISGKTAGGSEITVYDGANEAGRTASNMLGTWQLTFDLVNPYKMSEHVIYAVVSSDFMSDITSEYYIVEYNPDMADVKKVTMINTAHPDANLKPTEYETVFDFENPSNSTYSYKYWPLYPKFTFEIEIDGQISDETGVQLCVYTEDGGSTVLDAEYDEAKGIWIAYGDFTANNCPMNVEVWYECEDTYDFSVSDFNKIACQPNISDAVKSDGEINNEISIIDAENGLYAVGDCIMTIKDTVQQATPDEEYDYINNTGKR